MIPSETELILRIALATALGALVGVERELSDKPAGLRTHALVALGSAAFTVAGYGVLDLPASLALHPDPGRIAAQVVTGIGFLGAGIIIFHGEKIKGLTTAAELWAVATIGVLCGLGAMQVALATSVLGIIVVVAMRPLERWLAKLRRRYVKSESLE